MSGASVTTASDLADRVGGSLKDAKNLSGKLGTALTIVALVAAFLIATLLTLSAVTKRIRELGTLKALGWPGRTVVRQVTGESVLQGVLGGVLGALIGIGGAALVTALAPTLEATVAGAAARPAPGGRAGGGVVFGLGRAARSRRAPRRSRSARPSTRPDRARDRPRPARRPDRRLGRRPARRPAAPRRRPSPHRLRRPMTPLYSLHDVRRSYGQIAAVDGVDLEVRTGEFLVVAGPSGSGKTTLLQLLGALDRPTSGRVEFEGKRPGADGRRRARRAAARHARVHLPAVQPDPDADRAPERRGGAGAADGFKAAERRRRAAELLDRVGLAPRAAPPPVAAVGRRAAARRDRAGARQRPARAAGRRADRQPRHARRARTSSPCSRGCRRTRGSLSC